MALLPEYALRGNMDKKNNWTEMYSKNNTISYPPEYIIRIFKGNYPNLLWEKDFNNKSICDISCGDGRNFQLFNQLGFKIHATEISEEIVNKLKNTAEMLNIKADIRVGNNDKLPFDNNYFDYLVAWNCLYYINPDLAVNDIPAIPPSIKEYTRVLKKGGYLVISIPKKTSFIYDKSTKITNNIVEIKNDPFKIRNGTYMYIFDDLQDIIDSFSEYYDEISTASIHDDCFGFDYHWHILVMRKK